MASIFAYWDLIIPLLVGIGLLAAMFYVKGTPKIILRIALAGVVLLSVQTILQGTWTERWRVRPVSEQEQALAARLKSVPFTVGNWDSVDSPIDERGLAGSRTVGYYGRTFRNRNNQDQVVSVYVFCGHPKDMTQHTPDQCYPLNGNDAADDQTKHVINTEKMSADFYTNCFYKAMAFDGPSKVRVFWSFSKDGNWVALPKFELLNAPALYKIYAITEVNGDVKTSPADSAAVPFLREFLPVLNASLFPPQTAEPAEEGEPKTDESKTAG